MTNSIRPTIKGAPGLVLRRRKAEWVAFWQCRTDIRKRGYRPPSVPLWRGLDPTDIELERIVSQCNIMQAEMLHWAYQDRSALRPPMSFDGTIASLIYSYRSDPDSPYRKGRYQTRETYDVLCKRIEADHGEEKIADLRARDMLRWHETWLATGRVTMAHSLVGKLRSLFGFGMTMLECNECARLCAMLGKMRFQTGKPRTAILSAEQANMIRMKAREKGFPSFALAQAIQFECMLRQRDVIGEWVPAEEPGVSEVTWNSRRNGHRTELKWLRGIRWSEIDSSLVLRHITSKRQKEVEIRLSDAPMVMEEFAKLGTLPTSGPVIVYEVTGRPYSSAQFRDMWRDFANQCGIPKSIRNQDSRAGAITEATEAGAELEHIKHAATHSDISMTQRYARGAADKTAKVLQMRVEHRNKSRT